MPFLSKLRAAFQYLRRPVTPPAPLYPEATTELEVLNNLLTDHALFDAFKAFGLTPSDLEAVDVNRLLDTPQESTETLLAVRTTERATAYAGATGTLSTKHLRQENLLAFLITRGSAATRLAIENIGMPPAALLFWLAHREHEPALRAGWPVQFPNGARLSIVNDPYTPMEVVLSCFSEAFDLPQEKAIQLMLRVHREGEVHLDYPSAYAPVEFCEKCNRKWRSIPVPLYIRPVAV